MDILVQYKLYFFAYNIYEQQFQHNREYTSNGKTFTNGKIKIPVLKNKKDT